MTESYWFYLVEIERILFLQHFSKVKNLPLRFFLLNYSVIRVILDLQPREKPRFSPEEECGCLGMFWGECVALESGNPFR